MKIDPLRAHAPVHQRRVRVLAEHLCALIPQGVSVLDVGSGDGLLGSVVVARRPDLTWVALDTLARASTHLPIRTFDGSHLPFDDRSFDFVLFVDVLHHAEDAMVLLREATRVARQGLVIKDHLREGLLADATLRFMDWVGNARFGVSLPYHYWNASEWNTARERLGLAIVEQRLALHLYPAWADWWFGRSLHFLTRFELSAQAATCAAPERS